MRGKLDIAGLVLGFIGLIGAATVTGLPMWKVTAFIGASLIVMETQWDGLWMNCYMQMNIRMQCKVYDSQLILPPELQAARGLMCVSVLLTIAALLVAFCGTRRTNCFGDDARGKRITLGLGGGLFLLACLTTLIPVCWTAHSIISNFYNPEVVDSQKHELGEALYLGWATAGVLLAAGAILVYRSTSRTHEMYHVEPVLMSEEDYHDVELQRQPSSSYSRKEYV
ncbi:claudin-17-like [Conger conger]|uniref:claudin-17-like n=1 Tax=Conger conger TaxID=82655 RepID=UPI002A5AB189|nr:claudin-17-like [Conger conger]